MVNIFTKRFYLPEEDRWIKLNVSAAGLRTINKNGLHVTLKVAKAKGYIETLIRTEQWLRKVADNRLSWNVPSTKRVVFQVHQDM